MGGGPVGIEFAGEIRSVYKDKKITIATSGPLMPGPWKDSLRTKLAGLLKNTNVDAKTNVKVDLPEDPAVAEHLSTPRDVSLSDGSTISAAMRPSEADDTVLSGRKNAPRLPKRGQSPRHGDQQQGLVSRCDAASILAQQSAEDK